MTEIRADLLIIGAGSGGLSVAAAAAQLGASVVLLEGHEMGGDCLNWGCVPSKALIASGKAAFSQGHSKHFGISDVMPNVDYSAAKAHVASVISQIAPVDSQERFEGLGVRVIREFGRFVSAKVVEAGAYRITARRVVIATGSRPFIPPVPGLREVPWLTNETLFDLEEKPKHLLIIGGGPIGMEMAQAHIRLGCKVTVIEGQKALGRDDPEMASFVLAQLRKEGVEIAEDALASRIKGLAGTIVVETEDGRHFSGSHLLIAVGRQANVERLDLHTAGIETTGTGIAVDADLRTSNRRVYAIGDVAGGAQFTHVAGYHASVIIRSTMFGLPAKARTDHIPYATYTDPELAQIGLTEAQARKTYRNKVSVVRFEIRHNDRLITERNAKGLVKAMVVNGRPVGVSIAGPQAGELINLWALVIANKLKMSSVAAMVSPYPTVGEINKRVAGAYFSPQLFGSSTIKRVVGLIQRWLP